MTGWEAPRTKQDLKRAGVKNIVFLSEDGQLDRVGYRTDEPLKNAFATATKDKLDRGKIVFYKDFVCCDENSSPSTMMDELVKQLQNYSRKLVIPKDVNKPPKVFWGGKMGYGFDDNVIPSFLFHNEIFLGNLLAKHRCL